jgi:hypothetical protein
MRTKVPIDRVWKASSKCTVVLRKGIAYTRCNDGQEITLQTGQAVTLEQGDRIGSLQGYTVEVEDIEGEQENGA